MRRNPFAKADRLVIKRVYKNAATLNFNVELKAYDTSSGTFTQDTYTFPRTVYIRNPHEISDALVDNKLYFKGDLNTEIAYDDVCRSIKPLATDPAIGTGTDTQDITDFRTPNGRNGGIDETTDTLVFDDTEYRFVKIVPKQFYVGTPSRMKVILRAI